MRAMRRDAENGLAKVSQFVSVYLGVLILNPSSAAR